MSSIILFGVAPTNKQEVSADLKALNINLLRTEPAKVTISGGPTTIQPNFASYRAHLPAFMYGAMNNTKVKSGRGIYHVLDHKKLDILPIPFPRLIVNWTVSVAEEVRQSLKTKGFRDGMVKGRPVLIHDKPTIETVQEALNAKCLQTSPTNEGSVNIFGFKRALFLARLVATFLRTHQYPAFLDKDHEEEFNKHFQEEPPNKGKDKMETDVNESNDDDDDEEEPAVTKQFWINLPTKPADQIIHFDEHTMPKSPGLFFKYEPLLCKFDRTTILTVVDKYFYAALADDKLGAAECYSDLSSAMGNLHNTEWGNIYAHIFKVIDISLRCQTHPIVMITANHYDGIFMRGVGYSLTINGVDREAASKEQVILDAPNYDSHGNALWAILQRLRFLTEDDRIGAFRTIKSIKKLKQYVDDLEVIGGANARSDIMKSAKFLSFTEDRDLEPTAANIAFALSFISDTSKDLALLPQIHHSALFETDRVAIVWSAFGESAPSFRVPGGKVMFLTEKFRVSDAKRNQAVGVSAGYRDVTKIGAVLVPYADALVELKKTLSEKTVWNPFGNAIVNASASHMNKIYEAESCTLIVEALRSAGSIKVIDEGRGTKRPREEHDAGGRAGKRGRVDDDL